MKMLTRDLPVQFYEPTPLFFRKFSPLFTYIAVDMLLLYQNKLYTSFMYCRVIKRLKKHFWEKFFDDRRKLYTA